MESGHWRPLAGRGLAARRTVRAATARELAWSAQLTWAEVDGLMAHDGAERLQADLRRQNALIGAGYRVLRYTWHAVTTEPERVCERSVLRLPPRRWGGECP